MFTRPQNTRNRLTRRPYTHVQAGDVDIKDRKTAEAALFLERNLYKDLVDSQPVGVYRVRSLAKNAMPGRKVWSRLKVELASETFCKILGVTRAQCEANTAIIADRIHPDDRQRFIQANAEGVDRLETFKWEGRILKGKEVRWIYITSIPRPLKHGEVVWTGVVMDITERRQIEEALRESEMLYRSLFAQAADSITVFDPKTGDILDFNDEACRSLGFTREEFARLKAFDLEAEESPTEMRRHIQRVMKAGGGNFQTKHRTKDGRLLHVEVRPKVLCIGGKWIMQVISRDITDRKQAEACLRESEERLQALFNGSSDAIMLIDGAGRAAKANPAMCKRLGVSLEDLVGKSPFTLFPRSLARSRRASFRKVLRSGKALRYTDERLGRTMETYMSPSKGSDGEVAGVIVLVHDITELKQAEERLRKANEELESKIAERTAKLQALATEVTRVEVRERRRIAYILHEDIQQRLAGLKYKAESLKDAGGNGAVTEIANSLTDGMDEIIQLTRTLSTRLAPPVLYEMGLRESMDWLTLDMKRGNGLDIRVTGHRSIQLPSEEIHTFVFDAVRELLLNVSKHAGVKSAEIRVRKAGGRRVAIHVLDQGKGCADIHKHSSSLGLFSIRERAQVLGLDFQTTSVPGKGTHAILTLPTR